jgi:hypothetical protein
VSGAAEDWIADAGRAGTELREQIRLAHEATRDLKQARKDLQDALAEAKASIDARMEQEVSAAIDAAVKKLGQATAEAMRQSVAKVQSEFDTLADIMMGRGREDGAPDLSEVAAAYRIVQIIRRDPALGFALTPDKGTRVVKSGT